MTNMGFSSVGIVVGLPLCGRPTTPLWGVSLATQNYPLNTKVTQVVTMGVEVGEARNQLVKHALDNNATYVWFLDDDVLPPPFACQRLGYNLDKPENKDVMVCAGIYCSKQDPPTPVVYKKDGNGAFWDWKLNEVFEVESVGTGCMLIKTEVFRHLEPPYFKTVSEYVKDPKTGEVGTVMMTDDIYFCKKVRAAGFKILAHGGVLCEHYNLTDDKFYKLPEDSYPVQAALAEEKAKAVQPA